MEQDLENLRTELFYSMALAIKLSHSANGLCVNFSTQTLFERAQMENIKFTQYPTWIANAILQLITESEELKKNEERKAAQLTAQPAKQIKGNNNHTNYRSKK